VAYISPSQSLRKAVSAPGWETLAGLFAVAAAALLAAAAARQTFADPRVLFMDTIAAAELTGYCCRAYYGFVSNLGVVLWCASAGAAILAALCLASAKPVERLTVALGLAGALSLAFGLDDLLMLHESVLPGWGAPQTLILGLYAGLVAVYVALVRRTLATPLGLFLWLALALLAASVAIDVVAASTETRTLVAEDALKFIGITAWTVFHVRLSALAIRTNFIPS